MIELINNFNTSIEENNGTFMVLYSNDPLTGYCEYKKVEVNNRFKQVAFILTDTDMGDVIEFIHANKPLSDDDLMTVNKLIRDHSLKVVQDHHQ